MSVSTMFPEQNWFVDKLCGLTEDNVISRESVTISNVCFNRASS